MEVEVGGKIAVRNMFASMSTLFTILGKALGNGGFGFVDH